MPPGAIRLLRLEGLAVLGLSLLLYARYGRGWLLFALLFFVPDVSFAGYLRSPAFGALVYNAAHTYAASAVLAGLGLVLDQSLLVALALVWFAHIGFDRALGYGLKLPTGFHDTHLGPIGPARRRERPG